MLACNFVLAEAVGLVPSGYADYHFFSCCTWCCLRRHRRWARVTASEVATAVETQVDGAELTTDAGTVTDAPRAGPARIRRLTQQGRWLTAALTVASMATAIWVLSAHANRINQQNAEAMWSLKHN